MSITLFDDQVVAVNAVREQYRAGKKSPLLVAPTGWGKTVVFSAICHSAAARGNKVMILVHRQELIDQVSKTLGDLDVRHGIIDPQHTFNSQCQVQVASVFTLVRRLAQTRRPDLIIIDEAHHAIPKSSWGKCIAAYPGARLLGVTATPIRLSGEGLGDLFDCLVRGPNVEDLIGAGRLAPVRVFAPPTIDTSSLHTRMGEYVASELNAVVDKPKVTGDAIEHYKNLTPGKRAAVFCVSLEHAEKIAQAARAAGIVAVMIEGKTDKGVRRDVIRDFGQGKIQWLVTVDLVSEGFDCPGIEVGISLRPTQSTGLWLQQCGRCIRAHPGKSGATILDHSGNSLRHGLPTETRDWSLAGTVEKSGRSRSANGLRICPRCFSAQISGKSVCGNCSQPFPVESRTVRSVGGTLEELTPERAAARRSRVEVGQTKTLEQLTALGRLRNYKNPEAWAMYVMQGREKKRAMR